LGRHHRLLIAGPLIASDSRSILAPPTPADQPAFGGNEESKMLKLYTAAALLAGLCYAGTASAHGTGGGFEPRPLTNYTDMPPYSPQPIAPVWLPGPRNLRWQQHGFMHGR
jgi:hypothetical protein